MTVDNVELQATLSGEIYLKSPPVRRRFSQAVCSNAQQALAGGARVEELAPGRVRVGGVDDPAAAASRLQRVFGIRGIEELIGFPFPDLETGVELAADLAAPMVRGERFAVRCKRVGSHPFRSSNVERQLGTLLLGESAGVDLTTPGVTVRLRVVDDQGWLTLRRWDGPGGLPIGVQGRALVLLSGGYDSAVAAYRLMRRGVRCEFLHLQLACDQRDQALAMSHHLWDRWGAGMEGVVHVVDFEGVRQEIVDRIHPRFRQVALKRLMLQAADRVADETGIEVLATGEAIGQVSSQTFAHLTALDSLATRSVLRPLLTADKEEIVTQARRIGVAELAERAGEACDLADGHRVETTVRADKVARVADRVDDAAVAAALAEWRVHRLESWLPGSEGERRTAA
ncbi:MAG: tRNA sulfurtransferase [Actinomycetota bacterium]